MTFMKPFKRQKAVKALLSAILVICVSELVFTNSKLSSYLPDVLAGRTLSAFRDKKPIAHTWKDERSLVDVPRILHFMLLGDSLPEPLIEMVRFSTKVQEENGFKVIAWRDEDANKLVAAHNYKFPGLNQIWEDIQADQTLQKGAKRADFIRTLAMWAIGGVHLDADFITCRSLDFMIDTPGAVSFPVIPDWNHEVNGCLMSAPPHHRLFELALETIVDFGSRITNMHNLEAAGPHIMAKITDQYFKEIGIEVGSIFEGETYPLLTAESVEGVIDVSTGYWRVTIADIRFKGDTRSNLLYHLGVRSWQAGREMQATCIEHPHLIFPFLEEYCSKDLTYEDNPHFERDCGLDFIADDSSNTTIIEEVEIQSS